MKEKESEIEQSKNENEFRKLSKNTFFAFLINYGSHFFTFVNAFFLARLITDISWDFLILASSFITIIVIISSLFPPGLNYALNFFIPKHIALNQNSELRSLIKRSFILKLVFLIPIMILSIIFFFLFSNFFEINLEDKIILLYILWPTIFTGSMNYIFNAIFRGFSKFNFVFIKLILREAIQIGPLVFCYLFDIKVTIEFVALITMIAAISEFSLNFIFIALIYRYNNFSKSKSDSLKNDISKVLKYGGYTGSTNIIDKFWKETQVQGIGLLNSSGGVTGFNIALNYQSIGLKIVPTFSEPLLVSLTSLNIKNQQKEVEKIYKVAYKFTLFSLLLLSGILYISVDFILDVVFLESRLIYSNFLKLIVLAQIFRILKTFVQTLFNSQNNENFSFYLSIIYMTYVIPLFFIGLIYFGVEGALLFGFIIGNIISLMIQIIASYKIGKIKLDIKKIAVLYLGFFIPLLIVIILDELILKEASKAFLLSLNLSLIKNFNFLAIGTFLLLFIIINLLFNTINSNDISFIESNLKENKFINRILIKGLNILKKFTRA